MKQNPSKNKQTCRVSQVYSTCTLSVGTVIFLLFTLIVIILQLTEWRPFGPSEKYVEINEILLNISYSYISAAIFFIVMDFIPKIKRKRIMHRKIRSYLTRMRSIVLQCIKGVRLYSFNENANQIPSRDTFITEFTEKDFSPSHDYLHLLNNNRTKITSLIETLLSTQEYLSDDCLQTILNINDSLFLTQPIIPRDYCIGENEETIEIPGNNQAEIAESIYDIYEQIIILKQ